MNSFGWEVDHLQSFVDAIEEADACLREKLHEAKLSLGDSQHKRSATKLLAEDKAFSVFTELHDELVEKGNPSDLSVPKELGDSSEWKMYRELYIDPWCAYYLLDMEVTPPVCRGSFFGHKDARPEWIRKLKEEVLSSRIE